MFDFLIKKLSTLIKTRHKDQHYLKLRDLFIGIVLNLTCNVENNEIITEMILKSGVVKVLCEILVDHRHDWPTNGAALALHQYCNLSLQESDIYFAIEEAKVNDIVSEFIPNCSSKEAKKNLYDVLTILDVCGRKMNSIGRILRSNIYAACA